MKRRLRGADLGTNLRGLLLVGVLIGLPLSASAQSGDLQRLVSDVDTLEGRIGQLESEYLRAVEVRRDLDFASRVADGRARYLLEDYESAAILLVDVVENETFHRMSGYDDAVYVLADSLFLARNFVLSRAYFERLLENSSSRYGLDASRRLLEIAFALNEYEGLDRLYTQFQQRGSGRVGNELSYVRGKAMYFQGRYADAVTAFGAISQDSPLYDRGRYFLGVCRVRLEQYDPALAEFDALLSRLEPSTDLFSLAALAAGRVHYQRQEWTDAVNGYGSVPRDSAHYPASLYELGWTFIRDGRTQQALNTLEILMILADEDSRFAPEAQLLRGDLLLRLGRFEEAVEQFEGVSDRYRPVEQELAELTAQRDDPAQYYDALIDAGEEALRLPTLAQDWFRSDPALERVLAQVHDVEVLEQTIDECNQLIDELDAALNTGSRVDVFPQLRDGWARGIELENDTIGEYVAVVEFERGIVWRGLDATAQAQYTTLRDRRLSLQQRWEQTPRTFADLDNREAMVEARIEEMGVQVYRMEQEIADGREQIRSMRNILRGEYTAGNISRAQADVGRAELDEMEATLEQQYRYARRLREQLEVERAGVGVSDQASNAERAIKADLVRALATEHDYLTSHRSVVGGRSEFGGVDNLRGRLTALLDRTDRFFGGIDRIVQDQTAEFRVILDQERENVRRYEDRIAQLGGRSSAVAGRMAYDAVVDIHTRFSELTLRANLGIIDVAWREKEDVSDSIEGLFDERNRMLRVLDADFAELLLD